MKSRQMVIPAVLCLPLLGGCAFLQGSDIRADDSSTHVAGAADDAESFYQLGRYYQGQSRYDQAASAYARALRANSHFAKARNGLGVVLSLQGRFDEAIQAFQLAIHDSPDDAYIHSNLGYAYYLKGSDAQAIASLNHAISLDPANARARKNLDLASARMGRTPTVPDTLARADEPPRRLAEPTSPAAESGDRPSVAVAVQPVAVVPEPKTAPPGSIIAIERVPTPIPVANSRIEVVPSGRNSFELRERAEAPLISPPLVQTVRATLELPGGPPARVEISNGNGRNGMAKVVGGFLREKGFKPARLTNQKSFDREVTQIEYRAGFFAEAQRLRASLPGEATLVEMQDLRKDIAVRLVLGKDLARGVSQFDENSRKVRLARTWQES